MDGADDNETPTTPGGWMPPPPSLPFGQPQQGAPPSGPPAYGPQYGQPVYPAEPVKKKRFGWLALSLAFIGGGLLTLIAVAGLIAFAVIAGDDTFAPETYQHGPVPEGAVVPKVGDCLAPPPEGADVTSDAQVVDCAENHGTEITAVLEVPGASHRPGTDDLGYFADDACFLAFEGYVGTNYEDSPYDYDSIVPSRAAWDAADRTVWCLIDADGASGTVRGSRG